MNPNLLPAAPSVEWTPNTSFRDLLMWYYQPAAQLAYRITHDVHRSAEIAKDVFRYLSDRRARGGDITFRAFLKVIRIRSIESLRKCIQVRTQGPRHGQPDLEQVSDPVQHAAKSLVLQFHSQDLSHESELADELDEVGIPRHSSWTRQLARTAAGQRARINRLTHQLRKAS